MSAAVRDRSRSAARETAAAPPPGFVAHTTAFRQVLGERPRLEQVVVLDAHEGPVYLAEQDALYLTSVPVPSADDPRRPLVAIRRVQLDGLRFPVDPTGVSTLRRDSNAANGMTLDRDGRLLVCEQGGPDRPAAITSLDPRTGARRTLVDHWCGLPLNSPNDVVVAADGAIWFTDPQYGHLQGFRPRPRAGDHVYRYDPVAGMATVVADGFDKPNGLALSPDGSTLYVADSGATQGPGSFDPSRPHHVIAFDVVGGRRLGPGRLFAVVAGSCPDGLVVDTAGRLYVCCASGVLVLTLDGDRIGELTLPGAVNAVFGGADRNALFITTDTAVWAAVLDTSGPPPATVRRTRPAAPSRRDPGTPT
jgi:gluconolactonase